MDIYCDFKIVIQRLMELQNRKTCSNFEEVGDPPNSKSICNHFDNFISFLRRCLQ